jgi:hypothetical protein
MKTNYVADVTFNLVQNGRCRSYTRGQVLSERQWLALPSSVRPRFTARQVNPYRRGSGLIWSDAETDLLVALYLKYSVRGARGAAPLSVCREFLAAFPERTVTSFRAAWGACQSLDTWCPLMGLKGHSAGLESRLLAADPDRFTPVQDLEVKLDVALDDLLAAVRA